MSVKLEKDFYLLEVTGKSQKATKAYLTKNLNRATKELKDIKDFEKLGNFYYLGEPIYHQIRALEDEIIAIKKVRKLINI